MSMVPLGHASNPYKRNVSLAASQAANYGALNQYNRILLYCIVSYKWSLICSTFLGTINLLHFAPLFVFTSSRYHIIF